jgi:uncharacterized protein YceK
MLDLAPGVPQPSPISQPAVHSPGGASRGRVALLTGCAQSVLDPAINEATVSLLNRLGIEVVVPAGEGCCGALVHHMGKEEASLAAARNNVDVWTREIEAGGLDAIIITASGCGTTIKDYGHMLRLDPAYAEKAARVSALAKDVTEYLAGLDLPPPEIEPSLTSPTTPPAPCSTARRSPRAEGASEARRFCRRRAARRASVLRLGRHLQHPAARDFRAAARPEGQEHRGHPARSHRDGQYRLHDPDRRRDCPADRPHGAASRLGLRRGEAGGHSNRVRRVSHATFAFAASKRRAG